MPEDALLLLSCSPSGKLGGGLPFTRSCDISRMLISRYPGYVGASLSSQNRALLLEVDADESASGNGVGHHDQRC